MPLCCAYQLWHELEQAVGEPLLHQVGLVQVGPPEGKVVAGVQCSAAEHGLPIESLTAGEAMVRWPALCVPADAAAVFESRAGYLRVEACVRAQAMAAQQAGAEL